jgi:hypothetical protein
MTTETALTIPERAAVALNSAKVTDELRALVAASSDILAVIDGAGREQAHRIGMNLKNARIAIEKAGKAARDDATKFSKGVIAEEARLVAIIEPEESRVFELRDKWDAQIEAEKQAKIVAERARVEAISERIGQFAKLVLQASGKGSVAIEGLQEQVAEVGITAIDFEEFIFQAQKAKDDATASLLVAHLAAHDAEQAIEAARIKREEEDRQRAAQAAENARVKAELDAQAAKQAAEAKRLADAAAAQQAEIERQQREAAANIKAQADAEAARQKAAKDAHDAEMKRQSDEIAAQRTAFEAQQQEIYRAQALAAQQRIDAELLEADHTEALAMNAAHDLAHQEWLLAQKVSAPAIADALIAESLDVPEAEPTDEEIIAVYLESFGGTREQAIARIRKFFITDAA